MDLESFKFKGLFKYIYAGLTIVGAVLVVARGEHYADSHDGLVPVAMCILLGITLLITGVAFVLNPDRTESE